MSASEIFQLYSEGFRLVCRYCKVELSTVPASLIPGQKPQYVACPNNQNHITLLSEPANLAEFRKWVSSQRDTKHE